MGKIANIIVSSQEMVKECGGYMFVNIPKAEQEILKLGGKGYYCHKDGVYWRGDLSCKKNCVLAGELCRPVLIIDMEKLK